MPMPKSFDAYGPEYEDLLLGLAQAPSGKPIVLDFTERRHAMNFQSRWNSFLLRVEQAKPTGTPERDELLARLKPAVHRYRRAFACGLLPRRSDPGITPDQLSKYAPARLVFVPRLSADSLGAPGARAVYTALSSLRPPEPTEPAPPSPADPHVHREHLYPPSFPAKGEGPPAEKGEGPSTEPTPIPFRPSTLPPGATANPYFDTDAGED